jgi:hypothetical protein
MGKKNKPTQPPTNRLVHARKLPELVLLASGDVWIHGGLGGWSETPTRGYHEVTIDELWSAQDGRCIEQGPASATPPENAVVWDSVSKALVPLRSWPGKPQLGEVKLGEGLAVRVGGVHRESAGKFGSRPLAEDKLIFVRPEGNVEIKLKQARADPTLTLLRDGRILSTGGYEVTIDFSWEDVYSGVNCAELIDPVRGTLKSLPSLNRGRYKHGAIEIAPGRVLIVGGSSRDDDAINSIELVTIKK